MTGAIIRISESAFQSMLLAALEAYFIRHESGGKQKRALETYGTLWGHITHSGDSKVICVSMASVETSAIREHSNVLYRLDSIELKRDMMCSLYPQYRFLGDFHTHAYAGAKAVDDERLWRASDEDKYEIEYQSEWWQQMGYVCGVMMTIARVGRSMPHPERKAIAQDVVRLTFGNLRIWVKACYAMRGRDGILRYVDDKKTILRLPSVEGMNYAYAEPGSVSRRGVYVPAKK